MVIDRPPRRDDPYEWRPLSRAPGARGSSGRAGPSRQNSLRRAQVRFVVAGLIALLVVSVGGWYAGRRAAEREAVEDARRLTITLARGVVEPALSDDLVAGDPAAFRRLDRVVRARVLGRGVLRVKLWTSDGRVVYSDVAKMVGQRFELEPEELSVLRLGKVAAAASDLTRPENRFDRGHGPLIEVYMPVETPSGATLLFETYQSKSAVAAQGGRLWSQFAPITLGGLALLVALLVPFAWSLARGLDQARAERETLLRRALDASQTERRRLAAHLHDGTVQTLAGSYYALSGTADNLDASRHHAAAREVRSAAAGVRQGVAGLRSLLVEIYPPSLARSGLGAALSDLVAQLTSREIEVELDLADTGRLAPEVDAALFRVAQEAVHNIVKHSGARHVHVEVALHDDGSQVRLDVRDDGRGMDRSATRIASLSEGAHMGLTLVADSLAEIGGSLAVVSSPGEGTCVTATIPVR